MKIEIACRQVAFVMLNVMIPLVHTCKRMDGEGLVGLNDIHLKLEVNGAAASQRNSMTNTRDRRGEKKKDYFFMV